MKANEIVAIFEESIRDYHKEDNVDFPEQNPYPVNSWEYLLYRKNWIDTVQWHLEDIIRSPSISPENLVQVKRRIDSSNQDRTDTVEKMDDVIVNAVIGNVPNPDARMNSETPAWLLDRLSILLLKIWHMKEQTLRIDVSAEHIHTCQKKLDILLEQKEDMMRCFDELIQDINAGLRYCKVYRQMKMYNDEKLNPVLYGQKSE